MLKLTCNSQEVTSPVKLFGIGNNNSDGFKIKGFLTTIFSYYSQKWFNYISVLHNLENKLFIKAGQNFD